LAPDGGPGKDDLWYLVVSKTDGDEPSRFGVTGRLGADGAVRLRQALDAAAGQGIPLLLDLSGLEYISGAGLEALRDLAGKASRAGGSLAVTNLTEPVRLSFSLVGPLPHLDVA
jgi:anti-anti-sigma factor